MSFIVTITVARIRRKKKNKIARELLKRDPYSLSSAIKKKPFEKKNLIHIIILNVLFTKCNTLSFYDRIVK